MELAWRVIVVHMFGFLQVDEMYAAMRQLETIMHQESNHIKMKLQPGQIVCLRNEVM